MNRRAFLLSVPAVAVAAAYAGPTPAPVLRAGGLNAYIASNVMTDGSLITWGYFNSILTPFKRAAGGSLIWPSPDSP